MGSKPWREPKKYRTREEAQKFIDLLEAEMPEGVKYVVCGSWRRGAPKIGDLDIAVVTVLGHLVNVQLPKSFRVQQRGLMSAKGDLETEGDSIHADFYSCTEEQSGAMLMFLTGPKALNIVQRAWAEKLGFKLNQYGLTAYDGTLITGSEEYIYQRLGMNWLPPEERQKYVEEAPPITAPVRILWAASDSGQGPYKITVQGSIDAVRRGGLKAIHIECACYAYTYNRETPKRCKHAARTRVALAKLTPEELEAFLTSRTLKPKAAE